MFEYLGAIGGIILIASYLPQIVKLVRTKSSEDISMLFIGCIMLAAACLTLYAYHIEDLLFTVLNTMSALTAGIVLALTFHYRKKGTEANT